METKWLEYWTQIIRRFDPHQQPGRDGVPAKFYVPRPDGPLSELETELRVDLTKSRTLLLTGHRGCGKTSELARLAHQMRDAMTIIWLDVGERLDMHRVGQTDLLIAMAATIHAHIPVPKAFDALKQQLMTVVEERLDKQSAALIAKAVQVIGAEGTISLLGREERQRIELPPVLGGVLDGLNEVIAAARRKTKDRPLLLIVDQTERLDLDAARHIFANNRLLASIDCRVVLAIPFPIYASTTREELQQQGFTPFLLPNIKLHERHQTELNPAGAALMSQIVERRLADDGAARIDPVALQRLIEMSGGVIRELVRFMHQAGVKAILAQSPQITPALAEQVIQAERYAKALSIPYSFYREEMAKVHLTGELTKATAKNEDGREFIVCNELLHTLYLLAYTNGEPWYDVHPLMLPIIQEHLKRVQNGPA